MDATSQLHYRASGYIIDLLSAVSVVRNLRRNLTDTLKLAMFREFLQFPIYDFFTHILMN